MKKTSKILSVILAILMVLSIIPITASAEELITSGTCGENLTWSYDMYTAILTISGTGDMYDYDETNRPWEIFVGYIEKVIITDGVTSIGENAFRKITTLQHVEIGNDVTVINEFAFNRCYKIDTVIIGSSVTQICDYAFSGCNDLDYIYYMGTEAEYYEIDWYERTDDEYNMTWFRVEYIFVKDIETDSGKCGKNLTWIYDVPSSTLTISGTGDMDDYNYDKLPPWYQWRFFIKNVVMEEGITKIGKESFNGCDKLESAIIPDGVKIINDGAFGNCHSLKNITIPDSVTTINKSAFSSCHNLTSVVIGSGVASIGEYAFASCDSVIEYTVDNDNQYFSTDEYGVLFNKDKTFLIQYTNGNTRTAYSIPDTVISIGYMSFKNAKNLTDVTFGKSVTTIDKAAFERCSNLSSVTIPKSLTSVDFGAFNECFNIKNVYYWGTENEWYNMNVSRYNEPLLNARIHYNTVAQHYETVVTPPNCTQRGYTTYTCECGYSYVDNYVNATGHNYTSEITTPATHLTTGIETFTCSCGDTYTEVIEKLEKHNYEAVVTPPNCTEQGYTTYTCECSDSYVADYVNATGHTEETIPAVAPTCTETGLTEGKVCSVCGETLTEQKELPANGHTPEEVIEKNYVAPTCTENGSLVDKVVCCSECDEEFSRETITIDATGHTLANAVEENYVTPTCTENGSKDIVVYCSVCDEEISRETETIEATGHADNDGDGYCDADKELLDPSVECECNCHKDGIKGFFWRIKIFFSKLFRTNKMCECGVAHY